MTALPMNRSPCCHSLRGLRIHPKPYHSQCRRRSPAAAADRTVTAVSHAAATCLRRCACGRDKARKQRWAWAASPLARPESGMPRKRFEALSPPVTNAARGLCASWSAAGRLAQQALPHTSFTLAGPRLLPPHRACQCLPPPHRAQQRPPPPRAQHSRSLRIGPRALRVGPRSTCPCRVKCLPCLRPCTAAFLTTRLTLFRS